METGEKYLKGKVKLGILGEVDIVFFKNKDKSKPEQPDYKSKDGALWINTKKASDDLKVEEEKI